MAAPPQNLKGRSLYQNPLRVFVAIALLAALGIYSGFQLPISLYPDASKPKIFVSIPYGNLSADEFLKSHGSQLESRLQAIQVDGIGVEKLEASYNQSDVSYDLHFRWDAIGNRARDQVETEVRQATASFDEEVRRGTHVWSWGGGGSGFLAVSFYSDTRSLDELYDILEPLIVTPAQRVEDAKEVELWNPSQKEVVVELDPMAMANLGLMPRQVDQALNSFLRSERGGSISLGEKELSISLPRQGKSVKDLKNLSLISSQGARVGLSSIAKVDWRPRSEWSRSFKTSGLPSIILFADPKPDGNIKKMSEDVLKVIRDLSPQFPADVHYQVLVDPSSFIRAAVNHVLWEVALAALLAVFILFIFIGSLRNVLTAAIEIPLSIVMAFFLMRLAGMNLNLISLGGLALSAGMNVDASVVVMENIFRHFKLYRKSHRLSGKSLSLAVKLQILSTAVREVRLPVIASTIASIVVFLPIIMTSNLTNAILGDLAKAVVFSHAFSAIVALILVPTVRLLLLNQGDDDLISPFESFIERIENAYERSLRFLLGLAKQWQICIFSVFPIALALLVIFVLPKIPEEVMAMPDSDFLTLSVTTEGQTKLRQMESVTGKIERELLDKFESELSYTFTQVNGSNDARIMARLKDKRQMMRIWKEFESHFVNTPFLHFNVSSWNPSELPLPRDSDFLLSFRGGLAIDRSKLLKELYDQMEATQIYPRMWTHSTPEKEIVFTPHSEQALFMKDAKGQGLFSDLMDVVRVATKGKWIGRMPIGTRNYDVRIRYPEESVADLKDLEGFPIGWNGKLLPLRALVTTGIQEGQATITRENQRELSQIEAKLNKGDQSKRSSSFAKMKTKVDEWTAANAERLKRDEVHVQIEETHLDLKEALKQLAQAIGLSVLLIFATMIFQMGQVLPSLLVLVAIPLGWIGVISSLYLFGSTLSLNSALGVILLNGLAVANSIILVDFMLKLFHEKKLSAREAAVKASRARLRPILITSLTTVTGMIPLALGLGDGGRILQPLGISVIGGLWFSTLSTLYVVPALQAWILERKETQSEGKDSEVDQRSSPQAMGSQ